MYVYDISFDIVLSYATKLHSIQWNKCVFVRTLNVTTCIPHISQLKPTIHAAGNNKFNNNASAHLQLNKQEGWHYFKSYIFVTSEQEEKSLNWHIFARGNSKNHQHYFWENCRKCALRVRAFGERVLSRCRSRATAKLASEDPGSGENEATLTSFNLRTLRSFSHTLCSEA